MYDLVNEFLAFPDTVDADLQAYLISCFSVVMGIAVLYLVFWFFITIIRRGK